MVWSTSFRRGQNSCRFSLLFFSRTFCFFLLLLSRGVGTVLSAVVSHRPPRFFVVNSHLVFHLLPSRTTTTQKTTPSACQTRRPSLSHSHSLARSLALYSSLSFERHRAFSMLFLERSGAKESVVFARLFFVELLFRLDLLF